MNQLYLLLVGTQINVESILRSGDSYFNPSDNFWQIRMQTVYGYLKLIFLGE